MALLSRRATLGAASAFAAVGAASASAVTPHPDAELIAVCAQHIANYDASGAADEMGDDSRNPAWLEYERTMHIVAASRAHTIDGILAKARATKHISGGEPGCPESAENCDAGVWAFDLMNDLLRLHGEIA